MRAAPILIEPGDEITAPSGTPRLASRTRSCARWPGRATLSAMRFSPLMIAMVLGAQLCVSACGGDDGPAAFDAGPPDLGSPDLGPGRPTACGFATFPVGAGLRRRPYLQSTTPTSVRVAWTTTDDTTGDPVVRYAVSPDGPWTDVAATSELFPTTRTGQRGGDYSAHDATLSGLSPDTTYCYEVRAGEGVLASGLALHTGWTGNTRPLTIIAVGDSGTGLPGQKRLRDVMLEQEFDVFLHLGDIAYTEGTFGQLEDYFFGIYEDFLHGVPTFPTIGNHEYETALGQPYIDVFYLFEQALRVVDQERYYSFDYGDVHLVSLDSNGEMLSTVDDTATDDMIDWLTDNLAASTAPWKIAFMHHPMYTSSGRTPGTDLTTKVLPVLEAGGIDLVLAGHVHNYERTVPLRGGVAATGVEAVTYVVEGAGGAPLDATIMPGALFAAGNGTQYSFLRITIDGCLAQAAVIADDGTTIDTFELDGCEP